MANPRSKKRKKRVILSLIFVVIAALAAVAVFKKREAQITIQKEKVSRRIAPVLPLRR